MASECFVGRNRFGQGVQNNGDYWIQQNKALGAAVSLHFEGGREEMKSCVV